MTSFVIKNPSSGAVEAEYRPATAEQIERALAAAAHAYESWRVASIPDRATAMNRVIELLGERKEGLASTVSREMGKRHAEAMGEIDVCASIAQYYADNAASMLADTPLPSPTSKGRAFIRRTPIGPVLGVMPWNYPYYQVFRFAAPNLMAGNTVLVKHASQCPGTAQALEDLFRDAGFPMGAYVNLFATHDQLETVIADDRVVGVSLTGSERAGAQVASLAGRHLKKVVLELGGSDPYVVLDTDDLGEVVAQCARGRLGNGGQSCNAGKRFIVMEHLYDEFVARMTEVFAQQTPGDPFDPTASYGPMASLTALEELEAQVRDALQAGARATVGGGRSEAAGCFEATVLVDVPREARAYHEELFGPVAVVHKVSSIEEAVRIANDSPFGLGAAVFHRDESVALAVADRLEVGMVFINTRESGGPDMMFGGVKRSGFGRELGPEGIDEFVNKKLIHLPQES